MLKFYFRSLFRPHCRLLRLICIGLWNFVQIEPLTAELYCPIIFIQMTALESEIYFCICFPSSSQHLHGMSKIYL